LAIIDQWEASFHKGFAKPMILQILYDEKTCYPYKITKLISQRTGGMLTIATSNIYPILKSLKDENLIKEIDEQDRKIIYGLTNTGQEFLIEISSSITKFLTILSQNFKTN